MEKSPTRKIFGKQLNESLYDTVICTIASVKQMLHSELVLGCIIGQIQRNNTYSGDFPPKSPGATRKAIGIGSVIRSLNENIFWDLWANNSEGCFVHPLCKDGDNLWYNR